jgi:uncharacterized membrane protein YraQ (UPF0718 family)
MNSCIRAFLVDRKKHAPNVGLIFEFLFLVLSFSIIVLGWHIDNVRTLSLIFVSIVLEALPFMLIGALAGGFIEAFVSQERMTAILPKRSWLTALLAAGMGVIFPVCECAVVPVVRRFARKGLPASAAVAYLLGGPIVNPIVAASTAIAYKFDWLIVAQRLLFGYIIAVSIGLIIGWIFDKNNVFLKNITDKDETCGCGHMHGHLHSVTGHSLPGESDQFRKKLVSAFRHSADDFLAVGHYLIIGAFIAALCQTFIDRKLFLNLAEVPVLPSLLMMLMAILLNLCSEADAFIAASFRNLMPLHAQMAFMLIGPMFDLKLLLMYRTLFSRTAIFTLAGLIFVAVLAAVLGLEIGGWKL